MDSNPEKRLCVKASSPTEMETCLADDYSHNIKAQKQEKLSSKNKSAEEKIFLLQDSTLQKLPDYAETLLNIFLESSQRTESEILIALIYCIALECGFAVEGCLNENCDENLTFFYGSTFNKKFTEIYSSKFPELVKDNDNLYFYKLPLTLAHHTQYKCILVAIRTGEYLVVTLTNCKSSGRSWCLSIPRYILSSRNLNNFARLFRNLEELSMLMKGYIFGPVRNFILAQSNNLFPGLTGLPVELCYLILKNLNNTDLQNLSKTCWKLRCICVDYYETKDKPMTKPYGSKYSVVTDNSSADL